MNLRLAFCAALLLPFAGVAAADKPNVLFIAIDDLRDWVGYLHRTGQARTPNIDRLARMGTAFSRSYCAAPVCNASRAALMSGMRPSTTGVYNNDDDWRTVVPEEKTLTAQFRKAGYFVCGAGKIYHESFTRRGEWDDYLERPGKGKALPRLAPGAKDDGVGGIKFGPLACEDSDLPDWSVTDYGIAQLRKGHDKPFFLAVGLVKPHMPWSVPQKWFDLFPLDRIELPPHREDDLADVPAAGVKMAKPDGDHRKIIESGRWKEAVQAYLATIAYCDMNVGRLLDAFEASPCRNNTVIVFWSDHGWHLGEKSHWRKFALWEEATRSPLIWVVPGLTRPGGICGRPVDFMSVYPTLLDLCGLATPAHVEGPSLRALLGDPSAPWDRPALTTFEFRNHAVRSESWRYIRYASGEEELYDETADPNEWTNLAANPGRAAIIAPLAAALPAMDRDDIGGVKQPGQGRRAGKQKSRSASGD